MPEYINFNKANIMELAVPAKGRRYVYDAKLSGLLVMVTAAGTKSFQVRKSVQGKSARVTLGRFPVMTVVQARQKALEELSLMATQQQSSNQVREEKRKNAGLTVQKVFDDYLKSRKNLKPNTIRDYRNSLRGGLSVWRDVTLVNITRKMVEERHLERSKESTVRANSEMRLLRGLFNYAMQEYQDSQGKPLVTSNPVNSLSHNKSWNKVQRRKTVIKPNEIAVWFHAVDTLPEWYGGVLAQTARVYFLLCLFNGYRRTECSRLTWEDVDFENKTITLLDTKNGESHELPMTTYTKQLLEAWKIIAPSTTGLVFRATDNVSPLKELKEVVKGVCKRSRINWTLHDLRRTFATTAEGVGVQGYTLKRLLNHKTGASDVTGGYIVTDVQSLREPMQIITDQILLNSM